MELVIFGFLPQSSLYRQASAIGLALFFGTSFERLSIEAHSGVSRGISSLGGEECSPAADRWVPIRGDGVLFDAPEAWVSRLRSWVEAKYPFKSKVNLAQSSAVG